MSCNENSQRTWNGVKHKQTIAEVMKLTMIPVMMGTRNKVRKLILIPNEAANTTPIPKLRIPLDDWMAYRWTWSTFTDISLRHHFSLPAWNNTFDLNSNLHLYFYSKNSTWLVWPTLWRTCLAHIIFQNQTKEKGNYKFCIKLTFRIMIFFALGHYFQDILKNVSALILTVMQ